MQPLGDIKWNQWGSPQFYVYNLHVVRRARILSIRDMAEHGACSIITHQTSHYPSGEDESAELYCTERASQKRTQDERRRLFFVLSVASYKNIYEKFRRREDTALFNTGFIFVQFFMDFFLIVVPFGHLVYLLLDKFLI